MWDPYAEFMSATLPNGLTVYVAHWSRRPWQIIECLVHSGSEQDPVGREGCAHFVEHLVSVNAGMPVKDIKAWFASRGGHISLGSTSCADTRYHFLVPTGKENVKHALSIAGSMLFPPRLEKSFDTERRIIINEFHRRFPAPHVFDVHCRRNRALYAGHFFERSPRPLGTLESIDRITRCDVQSYHDAHYTPANMSIICVGGMRFSEVMKLLSESPFAVQKDGVRTPIPPPIRSTEPLSEAFHTIHLADHINPPPRYGMYASTVKIPGTVNSHAVEILRLLLDEVLRREVRERRAWTYSIGCSHHYYRQFYEFKIECANVLPEAVDSVDDIVTACISVAGNDERLFEDIKCEALAQIFMIDLAGEDLCRHAARDVGDHQRIVPLAEIRNGLKKLTMHHINDVLQWFHGGRRWTVIGKP